MSETDHVLTKRELPRLRFQYGKDERLAFLGHLEVIGTIDRCVRRARLPFSIGNGFARRMRIQFSQALPVGASSCCEYFDVKLTERIDAEEALALLCVGRQGGHLALARHALLKRGGPATPGPCRRGPCPHWGGALRLRPRP